MITPKGIKSNHADESRTGVLLRDPPRAISVVISRSAPRRRLALITPKGIKSKPPRGSRTGDPLGDPLRRSAVATRFYVAARYARATALLLLLTCCCFCCVSSSSSSRSKSNAAVAVAAPCGTWADSRGNVPLDAAAAAGHGL